MDGQLMARHERRLDLQLHPHDGRDEDIQPACVEAAHAFEQSARVHGLENVPPKSRPIVVPRGDPPLILEDDPKSA
jgi:hypothetical protein